MMKIFLAWIIANAHLNWCPQGNNGYDIIIVDSSDPVGPAETLFQPIFYQVKKSSSTRCLALRSRRVVEGLRVCLTYWPLASNKTMSVMTTAAGWCSRSRLLEELALKIRRAWRHVLFLSFGLDSRPHSCSHCGTPRLCENFFWTRIASLTHPHNLVRFPPSSRT